MMAPGRKGQAQAMRDAYAEAGISPSEIHSVVARMDGRLEPALDPGVLGAAVESTDLVLLERDLWSALGAVSSPVLVVRGGVSAILKEKVAKEMVGEVLADGRLLTLPEAGHAIMIDDGPGLAAAIRDFMPVLPPIG